MNLRARRYRHRAKFSAILSTESFSINIAIKIECPGIQLFYVVFIRLRRRQGTINVHILYTSTVIGMIIIYHIAYRPCLGFTTFSSEKNRSYRNHKVSNRHHLGVALAIQIILIIEFQVMIDLRKREVVELYYLSIRNLRDALINAIGRNSLLLATRVDFCTCQFAQRRK